MTYDPTPAYGQEQRRSGPRWYSVIAFLVIAFLVMLVGQRAEDVLRKYDVEILIGGLLIFAGFATYLVFFA